MTHSMDEMLTMLQKYLVFDLTDHFQNVRFRDKNNLIQVMKDIYAKTNRSFVILIDEWDCLFREYQQNQDAQKKYLDFLRAWLKDKDELRGIGIVDVKEIFGIGAIVRRIRIDLVINLETWHEGNPA